MWREDALIWDRPRVVHYRVYFSIRRKRDANEGAGLSAEGVLVVTATPRWHQDKIDPFGKVITPQKLSICPEFGLFPKYCGNDRKSVQKRIDVQRNVQRFRDGLVFTVHRLLYHSTLGLGVIKKKKKDRFDVQRGVWARNRHTSFIRKHPPL